MNRRRGRNSGSEYTWVTNIFDDSPPPEFFCLFVYFQESFFDLEGYRSSFYLWIRQNLAMWLLFAASGKKAFFYSSKYTKAGGKKMMQTLASCASGKELMENVSNVWKVTG